MVAGYGYRVDTPKDPLIHDVEQLLIRTGVMESTSGFVVSMFPFLKKYPKGLPFSGFRYEADAISRVSRAVRDVPFDAAQARMLQGNALPSFVSTTLDEINREDSPESIAEQEALIRDCAATMYGAGAETTASSMGTLLKACVLFPDFVKRARKELDEVVGTDRLPTFDDWERLPYIDAIFLEVLRWNSVTPFGLQHCPSQDDSFNGYLIPKGSSVLSNTWLIFRDPNMFPDPETFSPERFLGAEGKQRREVANIVWGWGRRVCPGRQLAEAGIFMAIASVLAVFDVTQAHDEKGEPIPVDAGWTSGFIRRPLPFKCNITPRSEKARELIQNGFWPHNK